MIASSVLAFLFLNERKKRQKAELSKDINKEEAKIESIKKEIADENIKASNSLANYESLKHEFEKQRKP